MSKEKLNFLVFKKKMCSKLKSSFKKDFTTRLANTRQVVISSLNKL